jgi:hypothetical protein
VWRKLEKSGENCKSGGEKKIIHLFKPLTDFPSPFAYAGGFKMDKDSSPNLIASLHETHLKRLKNLPPPKQWRQPLQPPQPRRRRRQWLPAAASSNKPCF